MRTTPYLLLDVDGVLIPFPADDASTPASHVRYDVVPAGRRADDPVAVWLNPEHGPLLMDVFRTGLVNLVWCTSWRRDAATLIGPLLGLPPLPYVDLPRPRSRPATPMATSGNATTSAPGWATHPPSGSTTTSPALTTTGLPRAPPVARRPS